jgi:acetamidase/formamidase
VHAVTPAARLTFGFDADLNAATATALGDMLTWLEHLLAVPRAEALALASAVVDLHVTQVANRTWGVHASLPHDALDGALDGLERAVDRA